jgi:uncharacterized membrane protein YgcG
MLSINSYAPRLLGAAALAIAGLVLPAAAPASAQGYPQYAQPGYQNGGEETIHGRIISVDNTWNISVADDRGFVDNVELHQGTIINPTGLTLAPDMTVTIVGYANGPVFEANEIDMPNSYYGATPVSVYYGAGWWYPGYPYGYGPSFSLFFSFGHFERRDFNHSQAFFGFNDRGRGYAPPRGYFPRTDNRAPVTARTRTESTSRGNGYVRSNDTRSTNTRNTNTRTTYTRTTTQRTNTGYRSAPSNTGSRSNSSNTGSRSSSSSSHSSGGSGSSGHSSDHSGHH